MAIDWQPKYHDDNYQIEIFDIIIISFPLGISNKLKEFQFYYTRIPNIHVLLSNVTLPNNHNSNIKSSLPIPHALIKGLRKN